MPMADELSSREHLLAALNCKYPDNVHLASMIFGALEERPLVRDGAAIRPR